MSRERVQARDLEAFEAVAAAVARGLVPGDVVALSGPLGAGKTAFVAGAVRTLHGADAEISSPTFTFWHRYIGAPPVEHLDLYRLESADEATELGLHEAFAPASITLVEWPERLPALLPAAAIRIAIEGTGDGPRTVTIERP